VLSRSWTSSLVLPAFALFLIGLFVHGIYVTKLGFYWDDWCEVWVYHALGVQGISEFTAGERPAQGALYALLSSCVGISPLGWHLVALVLRCASSVSIFIAFSGLWPKRRDLAWCIAIFAMLYPGFTQQSIPIPYMAHQFSFLFYTISLAATILSFRVATGRWFLLLLSLMTCALTYLSIEYYIGLEFLRLAVIAVLMCRPPATISFQTIRSVFLKWAPYGVIFVLCIASRSLVKTVAFYGGGATNSKDVATQVSQVLHHPIGEVLHRASGAIHNVLMGGLFAWFRPMTPALIDWHSRSVIYSWIVGAVVAGISLVAFAKLSRSFEPSPAPDVNEPELQTDPKVAVILGLFALCVAGLPVTAGDFVICFDRDAPYGDRFSLPFLLGASMVLAGLIYTVSMKRLARNTILALLVFSCSVFNIEQANQYRQDWQLQKSLCWQLAWRAPSLKLGTSVYLAGAPPSLYRNHAAGLLNLLYIKDDSAGKLDYFIFDLPMLKAEQLTYAEMRLSYKPGDPIGGRLRIFHFAGTNSQSLVCWMSPSGTLRILNPPYEDEVLDDSPLCRNISYLSHPEDVISDTNRLPGGPLLRLMGPEPVHGWFYFYQKAELQRQLGQWQNVVELGEEAKKQQCTPVDASEWLPFVEGYARSKKYAEAVELTNHILDDCPDAVRPLSMIWARVERGEQEKSTRLANALDQLRNRLMFTE
jgi:hypothetical protein